MAGDRIDRLLLVVLSITEYRLPETNLPTHLKPLTDYFNRLPFNDYRLPSFSWLVIGI